MTKGNFISGNADNKNNNSMEIQINTQYSKKNVKSMGKKVKINNSSNLIHLKMSELKKQYVSPYSQKMIFSNIKV